MSTTTTNNILNFLIYESKDPIHPFFMQQNNTTSVITFLDAFTYIYQVEHNEFIQSVLAIDFVNNIINITEIQLLSIFYPIIQNEFNKYNYYLPYIFSINISSLGKYYVFTHKVIQKNWYWGNTGNNANANTLLFLYKQVWNTDSNPYNKCWSLDKIIYNTPSPLQLDYLQQNQSLVIELFETNRNIPGSKFIPYSLSPIFCSNYDVIANKALQLPFPVQDHCSSTST